MCVPEKSIVIGYIFPPGSSVVEVLYMTFLPYYRRQQVGATMLSTEYKIHESNPNSIEMNSGGMHMPLYV